MDTRIRAYQETDYEDLLDITKDIWDGNDYLPQRIFEFVEDPYSHPIVLERLEDGKVVSIANTRMMTAEISWLEALRTHVETRGMGFGQILTQGQLQQSKELGAKEAWLSTSERNDATRKILNRLGFEQRANFFTDYVNVERDAEFVKAHLTSSHPGWKQVETMEELSDSMQKLAVQWLLGEYKVMPKNANELQEYVENGWLHVHGEFQLLCLIHPSKEREDRLIVGVVGHSPNGLLEAVKYAQRQYPNFAKYQPFYSSSFDHLPREENYHPFRFMVKVL